MIFAFASRTASFAPAGTSSMILSFVPPFRRRSLPVKKEVTLGFSGVNYLYLCAGSAILPRPLSPYPTAVFLGYGHKDVSRLRFGLR